MRCLAKAIGVDELGLGSQLRLFADIVKQKMDTTRCDNRTAWAEILRELSARRLDTRRVYPDDCLRPVVERWLAFCASTSGVEQGFTAGMVAVTVRQESSSARLEVYVKQEEQVKQVPIMPFPRRLPVSSALSRFTPEPRFIWDPDS